jgi:hypothetical protein
MLTLAVGNDPTDISDIRYNSNSRQEFEILPKIKEKWVASPPG